ncbi:hypothetical protein BZG36_00840 [Bifiguratus adelaidae]|uniref:Uncharacterized protein n=1 Tax=Bifiguratus adelaidae TaxID=1938954 RepID=A0A261Y6L0_9FUNG|nr:hypothetical protein BZG36_00840 [Bifiguratus adelaidae]
MKSAHNGWQYEMRRDMQEIVDGVFLGPYSISRNAVLLQSVGITHVLGILDEAESNLLRIHHPDKFIYLNLTVSDSPYQNLIQFFPQAKHFIDDALGKGGKVLVYCNGGISRSPAFMVAYIMESMGLDYEQAYDYVQKRRFCMNPNDAFKSQLKASVEWEPIFAARHAAQMNPLTAQDYQRKQARRRSAPSDDEDEMHEHRRVNRTMANVLLE